MRGAGSGEEKDRKTMSRLNGIKAEWREGVKETKRLRVTIMCCERLVLAVVSFGSISLSVFISQWFSGFSFVLVQLIYLFQ